MANFVAGLGPLLGGLLGHLGIHGIDGLSVSVCVLGAASFLGFCAAVHSATRIAFLRCSVRR
jgi:hypothetical protein